MNEEINQLMVEICKGEGFNWICNGKGYNISKDEYRTLCKELLYAIESVAENDHKNIVNEVLENVPEWWIDEVEN